MFELPVGTILQQRYRIIRLIGDGGMGCVYEARDERLGHQVALKQLRPVVPELVTTLTVSFRDEAQLLARLAHPALPVVSDYFSEGDAWFLVMQFVPGPTLLDRLTQHNGPLPLDEVLGWADQILDALEYLHSQQPPVIHRDIKPENLKLADKRVMLLDFGIAKGSLTTGGQAIPSLRLGTPPYAPPEQLSGKGTDQRSDLYALAAMLYHLLTDTLPADAQERFAKLHRGQADPLVSPQTHNPALPSALNTVLMRALAFDADVRHRTAVEMRQALRHIERSPNVKRLVPLRVLGAGLVTIIALLTLLFAGKDGRSTAQATQPTYIGSAAPMSVVVSPTIAPTALPTVRLTNEPVLGDTPTEELSATPISAVTAVIPTLVVDRPDSSVIIPAMVEPTPHPFPTQRPRRTPHPFSTQQPTQEPTLTSPLQSTWTPTGLPSWVPAMVEVPAGPFLMGSDTVDPQAYDDEKPQHTLALPIYWIGRTEVTNEQFLPFIEGDGYTNKIYWDVDGWQWRTEQQRNQPGCWDNADFNNANQPVVCVSWYEAMAYAHWLSVQTGLNFSLPTEAEWEKAARGSDGQLYPWGDSAWKIERANSVEVGLGKTTSVALYPSGASPYAALGMAGNVWEWTTSVYAAYPYNPSDGREDLRSPAGKHFVLRGGSWASEAVYLRAANRLNHTPDDHNLYVGFRLAQHPSQ